MLSLSGHGREEGERRQFPWVLDVGHRVASPGLHWQKAGLSHCPQAGAGGGRRGRIGDRPPSGGMVGEEWGRRGEVIVPGDCEGAQVWAPSERWDSGLESE